MPRHNRYPRSFAFRLENDVAERLDAVAQAHGYPSAEWARKIVSEAIGAGFERRAVRLRVQNADLLRSYLVELQRQGNNLNQIARHMNEARSAADKGTSDFTALRDQHQTLLIAILDALGADKTP